MKDQRGCNEILTPLSQITPVLLSGGKSSRMGTNKSFVRLGDRVLIEIVVDTIRRIFQQAPLLVTNNRDIYAYLECPMTADIFPDQGPLGGIHAALTWSQRPYIFVFACDMPFLAGDFIQYMIDYLSKEDILLPRHNPEKMEPLHAIYSVRCLPIIERSLLNGKRSMQSILADLDVGYIDMGALPAGLYRQEMFMNINTAEHLHRAASMLLMAGNPH